AGDCVEHPVPVDVSRSADRAVAAAGHVAVVADAATQGEPRVEAIRGPGGERVARGVGQDFGAVGGDRVAVDDLGVHHRVTRGQRPGLGQAADRAQLDAAHALLAGLVVQTVDRILHDL